MKSNPWLAPFVAGSRTDRYTHLECRAVAQNIKGDSVGARAEFLKAQMREIFLCGDQVSMTLDQLLALGEGHALTHYGSPQQVLAALYRHDPWENVTHPAVMLTGLAGTGKTQLVLAMRRLLLDRVGSVDLPGHKNLQVHPAWFMSLRDGNTLNALLRPYVVPEKVDQDEHEKDERREKNFSQSHLLQIARRVSRRDGVCLLVLDEFQFITRSLQANALAMGLLLQLLSIGPRFLYVANYSLARRLMSRRQEDRHRVLVNPIELRPDAIDSADFLNYVTELSRVAPEDFRFDARATVDLLHRYSFGIKRAVVELLVGAWAHCKTNRGPRADVTESDLKAAYASPGYMPFRHDAEALWRHSVGENDIDPDLLSPLVVQAPVQNVVVAQAAINDFNRRVNERHVEGMLTPHEREALSKLAPKRKEMPDAGKVRRLPTGAISKASLLDAFSRVGRET